MKKWRWDHLENNWVTVSDLFPGLVVMLRTQDGCYRAEQGWTGNKEDVPEALKLGEDAEEPYDGDPYAQGVWQTLSAHSDAVVDELKGILASVPLRAPHLEEMLLTAARRHDCGKAHEVSQKALLDGSPEKDASVVWAKAPKAKLTYERRGFRHELASGLVMLLQGLPDLSAYLAAAHMARSGSRFALYQMKPPAEPCHKVCQRYLGWDILQQVDLGDGQTSPETVLDLSFMELGEGPHGESWLGRVLSMRDDQALGPFRLASSKLCCAQQTCEQVERRIRMVHEHIFPGCSPKPLSHYLKSLGIVRLIAEQKDSKVKGWWHGRACHQNRASKQELEDFFCEEYAPTPSWLHGTGVAASTRMTLQKR